MPRLTNTDYSEQRQRLVSVWEFRPHLIAELKYSEQHALHDFFAISRELYDVDAIAYRKEQARQSPSLPQRAGRAYARFEQAVAEDDKRRAMATVETIQVRRAKRPRKIVRVAGLVRPAIDAKKIAEIIVHLAIEDQRNGGKLLEQRRRRS